MPMPSTMVARSISATTERSISQLYDGSGPNYDAIWALGLRNPYRAYCDAPTGRLLIGA